MEEGRLRVQAALAEIALAWLVQQPWVITIPMSHNPQHLQENWDAAGIVLTPEQMARLDALD